MKTCFALALCAGLALVALAQTDTFRITGIVVDDTGQPVADALVEAYQDTGGVSSSSADTELNNQLATSQSAHGDETVKIAASAHVGAIPESAERRPARLQVAGRVIDLYDRPVAGASVALSGEGQPRIQTRTDNEGQFRFDDVREGKVVLLVFSGRITARAEATAGETNVLVPLGEHVGAAYSLTTSRVLKGVVTDPDTKAGAGVQVTAYPSWPPHWVSTDSNGTFRFIWNYTPWREGTGLLVARDTNRNLIAAKEITSDTTNLSIQLQQGVTIVGRVLDENGKPKRKIRVSVNLLAGQMGNKIIERSITTDANGYFEIGPLPRGCKYSVMMDPPGYSMRHRDFVIGYDTPSRIQLVPFVLKRANRKITGRVVDDEGRPVAGADVGIYEKALCIDSVRTDKDGRFVFTKLWESEFRIGAVAPGYAITDVFTGPTNGIVVNLRRIYH